MAKKLSHLDDSGRARMVDVGGKDVTERRAVASARVRLDPETIRTLTAGELPKGDAFAVARIAGIQAAKRTHELVPLCHPIKITSVEVDLQIAAEDLVTITATVCAADRTGVEMEALTAASVAALALYDMIKGIDRGAAIENVQLEQKSGGKSGDYVRGRGLVPE